MLPRVAAILILLISLTGCLESTEPEPVFEFSGVTQEGVPGYEHLLFEAVFIWYQTQELLLVAARVDNDIPEAVRAWRLRHNSCAAGGEVLGGATLYPNMQIDQEGESIRDTGFSIAIDISGSFHVDLLASPDDLDTVIACVDLVRVTS